MKKLILILLVLAVMVGTCAYTFPQEESLHTKKQAALHELAEAARALGLSEDNAIITEAQRLWMEEETNLRIIAKVVRNEAPYCTDRHQQLVAQVVLNRVASPLFPDNVTDVVNAPGQYNPAYTAELPELTDNDPEVQRAFRNARAAMSGDVDCPADVLYQSEFKSLGSGIYEQITVDTGWYRSTTYFNFG